MSSLDSKGRVFEILGAFAKLRKAIINFVTCLLSVCPRGTARLPLAGFSSNLALEGLSKICQENASWIKI